MTGTLGGKGLSPANKLLLLPAAASKDGPFLSLGNKAATGPFSGVFAQAEFVYNEKCARQLQLQPDVGGFRWQENGTL